jgi:hypothetical protein
VDPTSTDQQKDSGRAARLRRLGARAIPRGAGGRLRRLAGAVPEGLPVPFVAALAACVLVAVLYTVARTESKEPRGYAELSLSAGRCDVDPGQSSNVSACVLVRPGVYQVTFRKSLAGSSVLASRGSCCPGPIGATRTSDTTVLIGLERRVTQPIRATVFVP